MTRRPTKQKKSGGSGAIIVLLLLAPAALVMMPTSVLVLAGLAPTIVALAIDRDPEKSAAMTVGAMNLCGIAPFVVALWQRGHDMAVTLRLLMDPGTWLVMLGAAAMGWLMYFLIPHLVANIVAMRKEAKIQSLEDRRMLLIADWGPNVTGKAASTENTRMPATSDE